MQELKVIGIEDGALVAVSDDGDRFRIAVDAVMQTKIRQLHSQRTTTTRVSPREIQAHVRSGMSREQVAAATGASIEDIERYEGPVLAERDHMLSAALSAHVHVAGGDGSARNFGGVIQERLSSLQASEERWACWKDPENGWMVKVEFTADQIEHDARWGFDPHTQALQPLNGEAITLSQHGEIRGGLIPKLRAVDDDATFGDRSRFDSGAFAFTDEVAQSRSQLDTQPQLDLLAPTPDVSSPAASAAATNREEASQHNPADTADLLEALRKRRGERQPTAEFDMFGDHAGRSDGTSNGTADENETLILERETIRIEHETTQNVESVTETRSSLWGAVAKHAEDPAPIASLSDAPKKRGRTALPSWDEIVFGARSDDDPA